MNVYRVNENEWWAATDWPSLVREYCGQTGLSHEEWADESTDPEPVPLAELEDTWVDLVDESTGDRTRVRLLDLLDPLEETDLPCMLVTIGGL